MAFRNPPALASAVLLGVFAASSLMLAQTPPVIPVVPKKPAPASAKTATPVKPAAAASAKPVAATPARQLAAPAQAASSKAQAPIGSASGAPTAIANPSSQQGTGVVPLASQMIPGTSASPSSALSSTGSTAGDSRAPVVGQGVGTFLWPGGWTLTAYGCFRTGTRLFCDFDTTNQNNLPANTSIWAGAGGVNLVDDGGKITLRHNAFFVGEDGSQFQTAYISPQPVRFMIEYDDVDPRYTSISLVFVRDRIQGVPITPIDPSQPAGRMPARAFASAPASGTQPAGQPTANGALGTATNAVNNVNGQAKKAQGLLQSVQGAVQPH